MTLSPSTQTTTKLRDYIRTYKALTPGMCDDLIYLFEQSQNRVHRYNDVMDFIELNINEEFPDLVNSLVQVLLRSLDRYTQDILSFNQFLPPAQALEEFRVKRYLGNTEQQFNWHIDVGNYKSAKRYLAFLFYLNDDFSEGETEFTDHLVTPNRGDVLIFPPTWQFPHRGKPPKDGNKYIMSSYLNYT